MRRWWRVPALLALALLVSAPAAAQCSRGPDTSMVSIEGFGAAYYRELRTDQANDRVVFYGGVCVAGEGATWVVMADRVVLSGLRTTLALRAEDATLRLEGWTLAAARLDATREVLNLHEVRLSGADAGGSASEVSLDLTTGDVRLTALTLRGAAFVVRGTSAALVDGGLTLQGAEVTTCTCPGTPFYAVDSAQAAVDLDGRRVTMTRAVLRVAGQSIPLAADTTLDEATLGAITLPLSVGYTATDAAAGVTGTGLEVLLTDLPLADGAAVDLGAAGLDRDYPLVGVALIHAHEGGARLTVGRKASGGVFELTTEHALADGLDAGFDVRLMGPGVRDGLREGVLHARAGTDLAGVRGRASLSALAAASAQQPDGDPTVSGARLSLQGDVTVSSAATPLGSGSLGLHAEASAYPDLGATQWGVRLSPSWSYRQGPVRLVAGYTGQWTDGGSPFTTKLDRLEPEQSLTARLLLEGDLAPDWSAGGGLNARYDLVATAPNGAGLNRLAPSAYLARRAGAWRFEVGADAELAGLLDPDGERDGTFEAHLAASNGGLELGGRARWRWQPDAVGLESLLLDAAVPIVTPTVEVRPFLALDLAPTVLDGAWPILAGHGVELTFVTCCGALTVGYREEQGQWRASLSVSLERRLVEPPGAQACGATPDGALVAGSASAPATCSAGIAAAPPGIMARAGGDAPDRTAATGPPPP